MLKLISTLIRSLNNRTSFNFDEIGTAAKLRILETTFMKNISRNFQFRKIEEQTEAMPETIIAELKSKSPDSAPRFSGLFPIANELQF